MTIIRCPQCELPATHEECAGGKCPECGAALVLPESAPEAKESAPATPSWALRGLLWSAAAIVLLGGGGVGGYAAAEVVRLLGEKDATPVLAEADTNAAELESAKARKRVKELETLADKLRRELDAQKKQPAPTPPQTQPAEAKPERVKELEALTESLRHDLDDQKKQVVLAKIRADAAEREAGAARAQAGKPQDERVKELESLAKKYGKDLESQIKQTKAANARADAAQRTTDQVRLQDQKIIDQNRKDSQRQIEQIRQESQRQIDQIRQEGQRNVDQVRQELRKQQQLTQLAQAEAMKQKLAAEEARRKNK